MVEKTKEGLQRGLKERHIQLMSIGTAIGVGLFLGSSPAIQLSGPSIILEYIVCGVIVFIVMRALGELSVHNPVSGSFARHARVLYQPLGRLHGLRGITSYMIWAVCTAEIHCSSYLYAVLAARYAAIVMVLFSLSPDRRAEFYGSP